MTSELRRIAQGLIECLEDVTRIAGQVHHTAARLRDDAAYVVAVSPADPESRALALKLDASARACETGVHHANTALPKAIAWVESKIRESELTTEPASPGHERTPSPPTATEAPPGGPAAPDDTTEPPAPAEPGQKRHPLQDRITTTENPIDLVPDHAERERFYPKPYRSQFGARYVWRDNDETKIELRVHGPDPGAPPGSNSASGVSYRLRIGRRYVDKNGVDYHHKSHNPDSPNYNPEAANDTHIPWPDGVPYPSWENP